MAYPGELGIGSKRSPGHRYGDVSIKDGAKAHLGDSYHLRVDDPLHHLPYAQDAPFNAYSRQHEQDCLLGTRVDLLGELYRWADSQDERRIFWLSGLAGTGKSTVARTIARSYYNKQRLAASFFFSRGGGDIGHAARFVTSIAIQLANNIPVLRQHICDAIIERSDIVNLSLRDQWQQLVCRPLSKLGLSESYVVVIDALDECDNNNNIRVILQLLIEARSITTQLRVLLTSRPDVPIRYQFKQMADRYHTDFVLHDISQSIVDHDIGLFLQDSLERIAQEYYLRAGWPGAEILAQLVESASGLFIWAETACRFIREGKGRAPKRLDTILCKDATASVAPEKHLNELYTTVLQSSIQTFTDEEKEDQSSAIRYVLGSIVVLFSPLSTQSLDQLLSVSEGVRPILEDLHGILDIPNDHSLPIRLHHPSLCDFLLNEKRCSDKNFWVEEKSAHKALVSRCLELMSASGGLRQDICSLSEPGVLRDEIEESVILASISPELQYACRYWVAHLERSGHNIEDGDDTHRFLEEHFLHWLEAMSLIRETSLCVRSVARLQILAVLSHSTVACFLRDAHQFVLRFASILGEAPLQLYSSALVFSPETSLVRRMFVNQVPQEVEMVLGRDVKWNACRITLEGHSDWINTVLFSQDGKLVASASHDNTVRLWETATGRCYSVLNGHSEPVIAVVFSPDGQLVASASHDCAIRLWETATGRCRKVLAGQSNKAIALSFSSDGQLITSVSKDGTLWLWDTATGDYRRLLESRLDKAERAVLSPDGQKIAILSLDGRIQLWDMMNQDCTWFEGHLAWITSMVFSPDSQLVASASEDHTVRLWNVADQSCRVLVGHSDNVTALAFSPDGKLVASASGDETVRLWETEGHCGLSEDSSNLAEIVVFSPDGQLVASLYKNGVVRLWDITGQGYTTLPEDGRTRVYAVAFSPNSKLLATASSNETLKLWETATGQCRWELDQHLPLVDIEFSPNGRKLRTSQGDIILPSHLWPASTIPPTPEPFLETQRVYSQDKWMFFQKRPFLWLPAEYRPYMIAGCGDMACLACATGRLFVLRFNQT